MLLCDEYGMEQAQWAFSAIDGSASDLYHKLELYVARAKTDGHVPAPQVFLQANPIDAQDPERIKESLRQLMQVYPPAERALVERTTVGFYLPYYLKREGLGGVNETAAEARERQSAERRKKAAWRAKKKAGASQMSTRDVHVDSTRTKTGTSTGTAPGRPRLQSSPVQSVPSSPGDVYLPSSSGGPRARGGTQELPQSGLNERSESLASAQDLLPGLVERIAARKEAAK